MQASKLWRLARRRCTTAPRPATCRCWAHCWPASDPATYSASSTARTRWDARRSSPPPPMDTSPVSFSSLTIRWNLRTTFDHISLLICSLLDSNVTVVLFPLSEGSRGHLRPRRHVGTAPGGRAGSQYRLRRTAGQQGLRQQQIARRSDAPSSGRPQGLHRIGPLARYHPQGDHWLTDFGKQTFKYYMFIELQ